jgi:hypothetical protein
MSFPNLEDIVLFHFTKRGWDGKEILRRLINTILPGIGVGFNRRFSFIELIYCLSSCKNCVGVFPNSFLKAFVNPSIIRLSSKTNNQKMI